MNLYELADRIGWIDSLECQETQTNEYLSFFLCFRCNNSLVNNLNEEIRIAIGLISIEGASKSQIYQDYDQSKLVFYYRKKSNLSI
jgi:hypothetical protein